MALSSELFAVAKQPLRATDWVCLLLDSYCKSTKNNGYTQANNALFIGISTLF